MSPKFYSYCCMLLALEDIFLLTDAAAKHQLVFRGLYSVMVFVMPVLARMMMQQPVAEGADENTGPTVEYIHFEHGVSKESQLEELCKQAQKTNDGLDRILSIITTLPDMTEN